MGTPIEDDDEDLRDYQPPPGPSPREVRRRCLCIMCLHRRGVKVRDPRFELVDEPPTDDSLPRPSELDWKRELRRRR